MEQREDTGQNLILQLGQMAARPVPEVAAAFLRRAHDSRLNRLFQESQVAALEDEKCSLEQELKRTEEELYALESANNRLEAEVRTRHTQLRSIRGK